MKICPDCGQRILGTSEVCGRCGATLVDLNKAADVASDMIDEVPLEDAELVEESPEEYMDAQYTEEEYAPEEYAEDLPVFGDAEEEYVEEPVEYVDETGYTEESPEDYMDAQYTEEEYAPEEYADADNYVEEAADYVEEVSEYPEEYVEEAAENVEELQQDQDYAEDLPAFGDEEPQYEEEEQYTEEYAEEYADYQEETEYAEEPQYAEEPEYTEEVPYADEPAYEEEPSLIDESELLEEAPEESELLTAPAVADEEPLPDFPDVSGEEEKEEAASEPEEDDDDEGINLLAPLPNRNTPNKSQGIKPMVKPMARPQTNREPAPAPRPAARPEPQKEERAAARPQDDQEEAPSLLRGAAAAAASAGPTKLMSREHPEWDLDSLAKKKEDIEFTPVPPFVSAEEAARPSPFAPAKKTASAASGASSDSENAKPAVANVPRGKYEQGSGPSASAPARKIEAPGAGEISAATRTCPICRTKSFNTEKNCRGCGYQFPKTGSIADLQANSKNIIAMLAAITMAASVFTDMITYTLNNEKFDITLISRFEGYGFLLLALLALVLGFFGRHKGVIAVGALSVIAASAENYYLWYDITQVKKGGSVDQEIGFWLLCAGAGLILIAGIVGVVKEKKKQERYADYLRMR